jgi:hypothetical protein
MKQKATSACFASPLWNGWIWKVLATKKLVTTPIQWHATPYFTNVFITKVCEDSKLTTTNSWNTDVKKVCPDFSRRRTYIRLVFGGQRKIHLRKRQKLTDMQWKGLNRSLVRLQSLPPFRQLVVVVVVPSSGRVASSLLHGSPVAAPAHLSRPAHAGSCNRKIRIFAEAKNTESQNN